MAFSACKFSHFFCFRDYSTAIICTNDGKKGLQGHCSGNYSANSRHGGCKWRGAEWKAKKNCAKPAPPPRSPGMKAASIGRLCTGFRGGTTSSPSTIHFLPLIIIILILCRLSRPYPWRQAAALPQDFRVLSAGAFSSLGIGSEPLSRITS